MSAHARTRDIKNIFPEVLEKCLGVVHAACKSVGITRSLYYQWRHQDPAFAESCDAVREITYDVVESALLKKIQEGDTPCIIFFCKTKMKHRGYVERVEQTGKDGEPLNAVKFTEDDKAIVERAIQRKIEERDAQQSGTVNVESSKVN